MQCEWRGWAARPEASFWLAWALPRVKVPLQGAASPCAPRCCAIRTGGRNIGGFACTRVGSTAAGSSSKALTRQCGGRALSVSACAWCTLAHCDHPLLLSGWQVDEDGDAVVPRRQTGKVPQHDGGTVTIAHHLATPLADVGLQVWRGALLLADYAIHHQVRLCG